ncbi:unnamed protein product, partial [Vitis vinifera]
MIGMNLRVLFYKFILSFFILGSNIFECLVVFCWIFLQRTGARAMQIFSESVRKLWNEWELRFMVLLSLFLQIFLIIFSNRRKHTATPWIRILIWSAYLSADWVATVSLGILSNSQGDSEGKLLDPNYTLMAFWAPFLLLHLGGPDTISAYSSEYNELWLRHLLGLVVQVGYGERTWKGEVRAIAVSRSIDEGMTIPELSFEDAFKVVEVELSFMYDVLYTKATVVYSLLGILLRTASFLSTISTLAAFYFFIDRHEFSNIDINITYALLFGAIFLEIYAIIMLILSDWSIVWLSSKKNSLTDSICRAITPFRSVLTSDKRWSGRMAQNNLINSCLRDNTKFNQVPRFFDMNRFLERYWYMTWEKADDMKEPIFQYLVEMTKDDRDLKSLLKRRGGYVTRKNKSFVKLSWSVVDVEFDHSLLLWHIATDLYYTCDKWKMVSEVWVEMLCYAASHCGWIQHGQQLRRGGELLTHVCLLMSHLGLSEQFQILEGENVPKISRGARAMQILPERVRKLWNEWELRLIVPLSLFLEIVLIIFSNRRKYTATPWIRILIWSAYMCADWVATLSLGTLANSQGDSKGKLLDPNYTLMAFWAPFLLLHLGGPDTVAAYSIEENELWLRHLLGLVVQAGVAFYVFLRSWAGTPLTFLSIPMFVAGIIKYGERTWVLRFASKNHVRDSLLPGPDYADFLKGCSSRKDERQVNTITKVEIEIPGGKYLHIAYFLFKQQLSHLYADLILSPDDQKTSEGIIRCMSFEEAFKVVEMELSFLYDALYTKATVAYSLLGIILRTASFLSTISTLAAFCFFIDRHEFSNIDLNITYALLFGAIFLEIYSIIMLILSDWRIVWLSSKSNSLADSICRAIASFQSVVTSDQRWSRRMAQNNLIDSCLRDKTKKEATPYLTEIKLANCCLNLTRKLSPEMRKKIKATLGTLSRSQGDSQGKLLDPNYTLMAFWVPFLLLHLSGPDTITAYSLEDNETWVLRSASKNHFRDSLLSPLQSTVGDDITIPGGKYIYKAYFLFKNQFRHLYADLILSLDDQQTSERIIKELSFEEAFKVVEMELSFLLGWSIVDVEFDHSLLLWHIATDLCYPCDVDKSPDTNLKSRCEISKCLSEYMLYLLVMCPFMLPKGIGEFRFRDTYAEAKRFFQQRSKNISNRIEASTLLLGVDTEVEPKDVKGDKSKSVLFEACRLAKALKSLEMEMGVEEKWMMVSEVWVEMLCYAASHCGWIQHGQELRRGGELLTHVCLLMSHLGLSEQFQILEGENVPKMVPKTVSMVARESDADISLGELPLRVGWGKI